MNTADDLYCHKACLTHFNLSAPVFKEYMNIEQNTGLTSNISVVVYHTL